MNAKEPAAFHFTIYCDEGIEVGGGILRVKIDDDWLVAHAVNLVPNTDYVLKIKGDGGQGLCMCPADDPECKIVPDIYIMSTKGGTLHYNAAVDLWGLSSDPECTYGILEPIL